MLYRLKYICTISIVFHLGMLYSCFPIMTVKKEPIKDYDLKLQSYHFQMVLKINDILFVLCY